MPRAARSIAVVSIATAIGLSACAGTDARSSTVTWRRVGADKATLRTEFGLCGGDFDRFGAPSFDPVDFAAIDACMRAKGFERVTL